MSIEKAQNNLLETQRSIQEQVKSQEIEAIKNPILQRCAEKQIDPNKSAHQAYDRMHHRHNRT